MGIIVRGRGGRGFWEGMVGGLPCGLRLHGGDGFQGSRARGVRVVVGHLRGDGKGQAGEGWHLRSATLGSGGI